MLVRLPTPWLTALRHLATGVSHAPQPKCVQPGSQGAGVEMADLHPERADPDSSKVGAGKRLTGTQLAAPHHVKRGVDGLVADLQHRNIRQHSAQYARALFRRMSIAQQSCDTAPQPAILGRTQWVSRPSRQPGGVLLRKRCEIFWPELDGRASGHPLAGRARRCVPAHD